jgi:ribosomal protein S18 acetylase RimI-like enzyme
MYGYPEGCFIYAKRGDEIVGGVGCRKLETDICEMKRLYVYEEFQGLGIGRKLCDELISVSKSLGYKKMKLDTVAKLKSAIKLYEKMGFKEIPKYYENPDKTVKYMELEW